jgi:hypothetical protein
VIQIEASRSKRELQNAENTPAFLYDVGDLIQLRPCELETFIAEQKNKTISVAA